MNSPPKSAPVSERSAWWLKRLKALEGYSMNLEDGSRAEFRGVSANEIEPDGTPIWKITYPDRRPIHEYIENFSVEWALKTADFLEKIHRKGIRK